MGCLFQQGESKARDCSGIAERSDSMVAEKTVLLEETIARMFVFEDEVWRYVDMLLS